MTYQTLLRIPPCAGRGTPDELRLDLRPEDYEVTAVANRVRVVERSTRQLVYAGLGPVQLFALRNGPSAASGSRA